jgi:peptidoglycan hydrolase-like protein with peptidoglycan-binding domain
MRTLVRKLVIGTASVIALAIAGDIAGGALNYAADASSTAPTASQAADAQTSLSALTGDALRTDDIRWAQVELRDRHLYQGSLDGILGPQTTRALSQFQKIKGLDQTASLDAQTWEALTGDSAIGEGSSTPNGGGAPANSVASDLGR